MYSIPTKDIHEFDNRIENKPVLPEYTNDTLLNLLLALKQNIQYHSSSESQHFGIRGIELIIHDFMNGVEGIYSNKDEINGIRADILIANISEKLIDIKNKNTPDSEEIFKQTINEVCEQFKDLFLSNGTCAVGRSLRFLQIYNYLL
jgi:hypothetical protein